MTAPQTIRVACIGFVFDPYAQSVMRQIAPEGFQLSFAERDDEITEAMLTESDALLAVAPVTDAMMARATRLRFIQKWGVGFEKIDTEAAMRRGLPVAITAGANADTIAEHAIGLMISVMRRIALADRRVREGSWSAAELRPLTTRLFGKTIGIVGMGNIGLALARQLQGFSPTLLYTKRSGPVAEAAALGAEHVALDALLERSDVVTLHVPGGGGNLGLISRERIAAMKQGAVFVNVSRGNLVDEPALIEALRDGRLSGAGLDVFAAEPLPPGSPLRDLDNVVMTPHSAGGVLEDVAVMAEHCFDNIARIMRGELVRPGDLVVDPPHRRTP